MIRRRLSLGRLVFGGAVLSVASLASCSSDEEPTESDDTDSHTDGGSPATGATGSGASASGGAGGAEELGGAPGAGGSEPTNPLALPELLSETGLYEADMETLAEGVRPFRPQFALWTDGAAKRRWISLPEGAEIDTSEMDYWELPIGTKLWKEFSRDGVRVETRLTEHRQIPNSENGIWLMVAYQWRDDRSDADKVIDGVENASGTDHDIPSEMQCWQCHNQVPGRVIGFSAIQLAHDAGMGVGGAPADNEWTLDSLQADGRLSHAPPAITVPGTDAERDTLGYLHANCGHCHHPRSSVSGRVDMQLWLTTDALDTVENTVTYQTSVSVDASLSDGPMGADERISPSSLTGSSLYQRFNSTGEDYSMPPLGTEIIDPTGEELVREWIESL